MAVDFGDNLDDNLKEPEKVKAHRFFPHSKKLFLGKIVRFFFKAVRALARMLAGAIIYYALAAFLPQLREVLPHFFQIVDTIVRLFDQMCEVLMKIFL